MRRTLRMMQKSGDEAMPTWSTMMRSGEVSKVLSGKKTAHYYLSH
jgi:hypothetical protein